MGVIWEAETEPRRPPAVKSATIMPNLDDYARQSDLTADLKR
jgi:hypothetical protein